MPIQVDQGSSIEFTAEFLDSSNNITVPTSATLSLVYTDTLGSTASASIGLTDSGVGIFYGYWNSSASRLGYVQWSITAPGAASSPAKSGVIRVVEYST